MNINRLLLAMLILFGLAVASALILGPPGFDLELDSDGLVAAGLVCGILSCGIAAWVRSRASAVLAVILSFTATVCAGPVVGFIMLYGLTTGLGGLFVLIGAWGESGMDGVGRASLIALSLGAIALLGFASQAWVILRVYSEYQNHQ